MKVSKICKAFMGEKMMVIVSINLITLAFRKTTTSIWQQIRNGKKWTGQLGGIW